MRLACTERYDSTWIVDASDTDAVTPRPWTFEDPPTRFGEGFAAEFLERVQDWWRPEVALGAMVGVFAAVFGWLTWLQQANFGTFDFDMGVFDQEIWLAAHHLNAFVTVRGLNMWANHVNPIVYLLVPFYWLGAGPHFLFLVQTLALGGTAVPLWLLARDRLKDPWLALGVPFAWLLYPAVQWMAWWPFQPEYLAAPALVFAYWFATRHRWVGYWICVALVLATKEDAALAVVALGIVLLCHRRVKIGLISVGVALAWFLISLEVILRLATPNAGPFFLYQYSELGSSFWSILGNVFRRPWLLWDRIFSWSHVHYYQQMLIPTAFLGLLAPVTLLLVVPSFLVNAGNNQGYTMDIKFQYSALIAPGLFIAVVEGLARLRGHWSRRLRHLAVDALCACAIVGTFLWGPSPLDSAAYDGGIWSLQPSARTSELAALVARVPADAGVAASYTVVSHLTHRDHIYTWPNPWIRSYYGVSATQPGLHPRTVNYLVLDLTENGAASTTLLDRLTGPGGPFQILVEKDQALLAVRVGYSGG